MNTYEVIIFSSGFGGKCAAIHLKKIALKILLFWKDRILGVGLGAKIHTPIILYCISNEKNS